MRTRVFFGALFILLLLTGCDLGMGIRQQEEPIKTCSPNITIATFNIRKFSDNSRTEQELDKITEILKQFDLIAIQEITGNTTILDRTIQKLNAKGKKYSFAASEPLGDKNKERYAFVFNTEKIQPANKPAVYYDKYDKFIREPYHASFKANKFDFEIITIHIKYGQNWQNRTEEMKQIADVYKYYQDKNPENDIILTGDFNTQPWEDNFDYIWEIPDVKIAIREGETTIGKYGNLYDNIIFTKTATNEYTGINGVYNFEEKLGLTKKEATKQIPDHRPVYAIFCTGTDDD